MMNVEEIKEYLPQRYPFLLVDRVLEIELGKRILAYKNVTVNEEFFQGHFPGKPIMPGVLIIEALAQAAGVLGFKSQEKKAICIILSAPMMYVSNVRWCRVTSLCWKR